MEPVRVKSKIEYWGKRAGGVVNARGEMIVKLPQWGVGATGAGPTGYKLKPARVHARAMAEMAAQYRNRSRV